MITHNSNPHANDQTYNSGNNDLGTSNMFGRLAKIPEESTVIDDQNKSTFTQVKKNMSQNQNMSQRPNFPRDLPRFEKDPTTTKEADSGTGVIFPVTAIVGAGVGAYFINNNSENQEDEKNDPKNNNTKTRPQKCVKKSTPKSAIN